MKKKFIYIAYTGGTIGMKKTKYGYTPVSGYLQKQLIKMPEFHNSEMPNFTIKEYQPLIDSSNMTPLEWQIIADDIKKTIINMMDLLFFMERILWHIQLLLYLLY